MFAVAFLGFVSLAAAHPVHGSGGCAHEQTQQHEGGERNIGYFFNRQVRYADEGMQHGRSLQTTATWADLRIHIQYVSTTGAGALETWLKETLIPAAVTYIKGALQVVPVSGTLKAARTCSSRFATANKCATEGALPTCGIEADGTTKHTIESTLLDSLETCDQCYTDGTPCTGCSTVAAGAGVTADFILFVSSVNTAACGGGTLAYASTCQRDQNDRPIVGYVNFCPSQLSNAANAWVTQKSTAVHELFHAVGFSSGSWPLFRNADGTPMTPRESDGLPREMALNTVRCTDGNMNAASTQLEISASTLEVVQERGTWVTRLLTPRVVSVARDIFGCTTLRGPELENQPTSNTACYASHWEQRNFMNELMAPISSHTSVYSALTLAALEDSGWYRANYANAEPLLWGRNKGCSFLSEKCVGGSSGTLDGFCTVSLSPSPPQPAGAYGCTPGHRSKGYCDLETKSSDIAPAAYQYITGQPRQGGSMPEADYCPHYRGANGGACDLSSNAPSTNYYGESYASGSMCFDTSVVLTGWVHSGSVTQGCYSTRCSGGSFQVGVLLGDGSTEWLTCTGSANEQVQGSSSAWTSGVSGGKVHCPATSALLCNPHACPGLPCDGNAEQCFGGVCVCGAAWGTTCSNTPLPRSPPPSATSPAAPGSSVRSVVKFRVTCEGTVEAFDKAAFKDGLATFLGDDITKDDIKLTVTAASIHVDVKVVAPTASAASAASSSISSATVSSLSTALGVTVTSVSTPTISLEEIAAPHPPPPIAPSPASPPGLTLNLPLMLAFAGGVIACIVIGVLIWFFFCYKRRNRKMAPEGRRAGAEAAAGRDHPAAPTSSGRHVFNRLFKGGARRGNGNV